MSENFSSRARIIKLAVLRDNNNCPYGLPIPLACQKVGDIILQMKPLMEDQSNLQSNQEYFAWFADGNRCPFAKQIFEESVDCSFKEEKQVPAGSPIYQKMFSGSITDGLYAAPGSTYYSDSPTRSGPYYHMYGIESVAKEKK